MFRKAAFSMLAGALASLVLAPLSAFADIPPPIHVTAKGREITPILVSPPAPSGSQYISAPVLQICHAGGGAANAVILSNDPENDEADTVETVIAPGQCVFISARLVRLTTNTASSSTAILVQMVG